MSDKKSKWIRPTLIVFTRTNNQEHILEACKTEAGGSTGPDNQFHPICQGYTGDCYICWERTAS